MPPKRGLEISDIQDETDIYDRLIIKQHRGKRKTSDKSPLLSDKVRQVDEKRKRRTLLIPSHNSKIEHDGIPQNITNSQTPQDDMPVVVETNDYDQWLSSVPREQLKEAIYHYDELHIDEVFDEPQNCMFRLYATAASFDKHHLLLFPKEVTDVYVAMLYNIVTKQNAANTMKEKFARNTSDHRSNSSGDHDSSGIGKYLVSGNTGDAPASSGKIIKRTENFPVPPRILRLLDT